MEHRPAHSRRELFFQIAGLLLIVLLFATNVYRAATQSITTDEAFNFRMFIDTPFSTLLRHYDAANHVLYTLLARWSVRWFGLSEFTLRLPGVLAGLAYLFAVFQLSRYVFGRGWLFLVSLAAIALNPFVLDHLSAARGYGLALALFAWGLYLLVRYICEDYDPPLRLLPRAGLLFGLAIAANLVFVFPVLAAAGTLTCPLVAEGGRRKLWLAVDRVIGPAVVPAFVLLVLPLCVAQRSNFYYGAQSLYECSESLVRLSLFHATPLHLPPPFLEWRARTLIATYAVPALAAVVVGFGLLAIARSAGAAGLARLSRAERLLALAGGTLGFSFALVIAAHFAFGLAYPIERTGIYFVFLFTLGSIAVGQAVSPVQDRLRPVQSGRLVFSLACLALLAIAIARFAGAYTTAYYGEWRYDAGTKRLMAALVRQPHASQVRLGVSGLLEPTVNFYRRLWRLNWLPKVDRSGPDRDGCDFYLLQIDDAGLVQRRGLAIVFADTVSGAVLAKPGQAKPPVPRTCALD